MLATGAAAWSARAGLVVARAGVPLLRFMAPDSDVILFDAPGVGG